MWRPYLHHCPAGVLLMSLCILVTPVFPAPQSTLSSNEPQYRRVCYYTNWSQYRKNGARFLPANIDPFLCTHIVFAFAKVDQRGQLAPYEWNDIQYPYVYRQFTSLKKKNPALKTLLAVGGWTHGSRPFTEMVRDKKGRRTFLDHAVQYLRTHNFDGLDLDWEYPANRGSPPEDKDNFSKLLKELREGFEAEASRTGKPRLLLTAAVAGGEKIVRTAYDVPKLDKYLDFINLMSYDLHGSWSSYLGHNAPLYGGDHNTDEPTLTHSVHDSVQLWLRLGASREKLVMGVPFYGRSFSLCNGDDNKPGMRNCGSGKAAPYTQEKGFVSFYEMEANLANGWQKVWLEDEKVPYAFHKPSKQWVGYDDIDSIKIKAKYIKDQELGGAMVWALDLDDFTGLEHPDAPYPLGRALRSELTNNQQFPHFKPPPNPDIKKKKKNGLKKLKSITEDKFKGRKKKVESQPALNGDAKKLKLARLSHTQKQNNVQKPDTVNRDVKKMNKPQSGSPFSSLAHTLGGLSSVARSIPITSAPTPTTSTTTSTKSSSPVRITTATSTTTTSSPQSTQQQGTSKPETTASPANNPAGKDAPLSQIYQQKQKTLPKPTTSPTIPAKKTVAPTKPKRPVVVNPYIKYKSKFFTTAKPQTDTDRFPALRATSTTTTTISPGGEKDKDKREKKEKVAASTTLTTSPPGTTPTARLTPEKMWKSRSGTSDTIERAPASKVTQAPKERKLQTLPTTKPTATSATTRLTRHDSATTTTSSTTVSAIMAQTTTTATVLSDDSVDNSGTSQTTKSITSQSRSRPTLVTDKQWLLHAMTTSTEPSRAYSITKQPPRKIEAGSKHVDIKASRTAIEDLAVQPNKPTGSLTSQNKKIEEKHRTKISTVLRPGNSQHVDKPAQDREILVDNVAEKRRSDTKILNSFSVKSGKKVESKNLRRNPAWLTEMNGEKEDVVKKGTSGSKDKTYKPERTSANPPTAGSRNVSPTDQTDSVTRHHASTRGQVTSSTPQPTTKSTVTNSTPQPTTKSTVTSSTPQPTTKSTVTSSTPQPTTKSTVTSSTPQPTTKSTVTSSTPQPTTKSTVTSSTPQPTTQTTVTSSTPQPSTRKVTKQTKAPILKHRQVENSIYSSMDGVKDTTTRQEGGESVLRNKDQDKEIKSDLVSGKPSPAASTTLSSPSSPGTEVRRRTRWWEATTKPSRTTSTSTASATVTSTVVPLTTTATSPSAKVRSSYNFTATTDSTSPSVKGSEAMKNESTTLLSKHPRDRTTAIVTGTSSKPALAVTERQLKSEDNQTTTYRTLTTTRKTLTPRTSTSTSTPGGKRGAVGSQTVKAPVSPFVTDKPAEREQEEQETDTSRARLRPVAVPRRQAEDPSIRRRTKSPHPVQTTPTRFQRPAPGRPQHPSLKMTQQDGDSPQRYKNKLHSVKINTVQDADTPKQLKWWHRTRRPMDWVRRNDIQSRYGQTRPPASTYTPTTKDCDKKPKIEQFKATGRRPENMRAGEVTYQVRQPEVSPRFRKTEVPHEMSGTADMASTFDNTPRRMGAQETQFQPAYNYNPPNFEFECPTVFGIYSDPSDCRRFYQCVWLVAFHHVCGPGTVWNDDMKICDWPTASSCRT